MSIATILKGAGKLATSTGKIAGKTGKVAGKMAKGAGHELGGMASKAGKFASKHGSKAFTKIDPETAPSYLQKLMPYKLAAPLAYGVVGYEAYKSTIETGLSLNSGKLGHINGQVGPLSGMTGGADGQTGVVTPKLVKAINGRGKMPSGGMDTMGATGELVFALNNMR